MNGSLGLNIFCSFKAVITFVFFVHEKLTFEHSKLGVGELLVKNLNASNQNLCTPSPTHPQIWKKLFQSSHGELSYYGI